MPTEWTRGWDCGFFQSGLRAWRGDGLTPGGAARAELMQTVDSALASCGLTRDHDIATRNRLIRLLLGSPPPHVQARLLSQPTAYRDILRATARFIKCVHATRWLHA